MGKRIKAAIGAAAFGAGALTVSAIVLGNKRVDAWETLTPDDAEEGEFLTLSDGARMHNVRRGPLVVHQLILEFLP